MEKELLFIGATHGNEAIGPAALGELTTYDNIFDWIIGNPKALKEAIRYVETDLNRAAPGNPQSLYYEERRAAEILSIAQKYKYVIDIHGSGNSCGIFLIVTNITKENLRLASYFDVDTIVLWPSITPEMQYPLSEFFPIGLEIECGDKDELATQYELQRILSSFIDGYAKQETCEDNEIIQLLRQKKIYKMYGSFLCEELTEEDKKKQVQDFSQIRLANEQFIPVFVNSYKDATGVYCYKLREVDIEEYFTSN